MPPFLFPDTSKAAPQKLKFWESPYVLQAYRIDKNPASVRIPAARGIGRILRLFNTEVFANCKRTPDNRDFLHEYAKKPQIQQAPRRLITLNDRISEKRRE
jgi:hypothetical protein